MARPTVTLMGVKARKAVFDGVMAIYEPIKLSFGPEGKSALLFRTFNRGSRMTDDGVTIGECQIPRNIHVRLAAEAFKEECKRTVEKVGDGTSFTAVFGGRLFLDCYNYLSESVSEFVAKRQGTSKRVGAVVLGRQIVASAEKVKEAIKASAKKIETLQDLERIAIISVKDEELGKIIAGMAMEVGVDGFIDTVEGYKGTIETELIKGFRFPAKPAHKAFVNNPARYEMIMKDCHVLVTNYELDNSAQVARTFEALNTHTSKLIVVAPSFSDNVIAGMVGAYKEGFFIYPVKAPSLRTEQFEDLAINCGATFIDKNRNKSFQAVKFSDLGFAEKMVVKDTEAREDAVVTGGAGTRVSLVEDDTEDMAIKSPVEERIELLKSQLKEQTQETFKKLLERRIASMSSAVGIIRVGDSTQASALYIKMKVEDAVYACKAALRGGYITGGGLGLKQIVEDLITKGELQEDDIIISALLHPYEVIQGSVDGGVEITDDIIDPVESIYYGIEHAVGVVKSLIKVEVITPETEQRDMGDGEIAIANSLIELTLGIKQHLGLIQANEVEMERDAMKGLTIDEAVANDNG